MNLQCMTAGILYVGRGREKREKREKERKREGERIERKEEGRKRKPERISVKKRERGEGEDTSLDLLFHLFYLFL